MKTSEDFPCKIKSQTFLNQTKEIIYIQTYESDEIFQKSMRYEYTYIEDAVEVTFIKTRNIQITAVLLIFNPPETSYNIYILGDPADTVVNKYRD